VFFSFLLTKDHFSSSCSLAVEGGKAHEFVVSCLGVSAGLASQTRDGALVDLEQAAGLSDAAAVVEMLQDGEGFVLGQMGLEQRRALALREAGLAGLAPQQTTRPVRPVEAARPDVATAALAVVRTVGVEATVSRKIFHHSTSGTSGELDESPRSPPIISRVSTLVAHHPTAAEQ
jgi:hypothetical protein